MQISDLKIDVAYHTTLKYERLLHVDNLRIVLPGLRDIDKARQAPSAGSTRERRLLVK
jgi:hypothetical protein